MASFPRSHPEAEAARPGKFVGLRMQTLKKRVENSINIRIQMDRQ